MGTSLATHIAAVSPDFGAVGGASTFRQVLGALLTYGLLTSVAMLIVCSATWGLASANGNWQAAAKARSGVLVALGGAALTGAAIPLTNWLLDLGASL